MCSTPRFRIRQAAWPRDAAALRSVRTQVFIHEQGVPESLEWDGRDANAIHLIAETNQGLAIGTARLLPEGRIGRMAVLRAYRGQGVGSALLQQTLGVAGRRGLQTVELHAQVQVVPFYLRFGFEPVGEAFEEAGIAHQAMRLAVH
jgi:predicted GNAT family N-acyltransferase